MPGGFRQEVLNVVLAQLLRERGVINAPENMLQVGKDKKRRMPDLMVTYRGLRTAIEGEVAAPDAQAKALESAGGRVREAIAHIGVGVVYPKRLRDVGFDSLKDELARSELEIAVVTESGNTGFVKGNVDYLESALRNTFDQLVREDVVAQAVAELDAGIDRFAAVMRTKPGILDRMAVTLGIQELTPEQKHAVSRIGGLVLTNAIIFHEVLSETETRVKPLQRVLESPALLTEFSEQWDFILTHINYKPIFLIAREILLALTSGADVVTELRELVHTAQIIITKRAALRHDLMGRIYHRLLVEKKYLGTYYTRIPAATLLLKLALRPDQADVQWKDIGEGQPFIIADLACGTGTLLMAAAEAVSDNYISASALAGEPINVANLQRALAEDVIYGYDVLPSAIHLTASTLAIRAPEIAFRKMNMYVLPLGGPQNRLGTVEYLQTEAVQLGLDMFGSLPQPMAQQVSGEAVTDIYSAPIPPLDLCVMNPPFTRSVGGNLLFGNSPPEEREKMQARLSKMLKAPGVLANSTAGLGSVFVAVGDKYLKTGGRMALVLPKTLISGGSWAETRELLNRGYDVEFIVVSQDPEHWNFSESTKLSEVLLVARKLDKNALTAQATPSSVVTVNLWRNPTNSFEALAVAQELIQRVDNIPDIASGQGAQSLYIGEQKVGEALSVPWDELRAQPSWILPVAFAQADLTRAAYHLTHGRVWLPGQGDTGRTIPLCPLRELGSLGPDRRDIHDGFTLTAERTSYPAFWGHETDVVMAMAQRPDRYLSPRSQAAPGRHLKRAEDLWTKAGRLLLAERIRLNTAKVVSVRVPDPVLSSVWWEMSLKDGIGGNTTDNEKALAGWLNSTIGILMMLVHREETEGPWVNFKKGALAHIPMLDLTVLRPEQIQSLAAAYERIATESLLTLSQIDVDPVRASIDTAIAEALNLPDFSTLRTLLAQEPGICLRRL